MSIVPLAVAVQLAATGLAHLGSPEVARSNALDGVNELRRARREREEIDAFLAARELARAS